jgi:hypothetical protein
LLYAIIVKDDRGVYKPNEYVCTSKVASFEPQVNLIKTKSGNLYKLLGEGVHSQIFIDEVPLLRKGYNPYEIFTIREPIVSSIIN